MKNSTVEFKESKIDMELPLNLDDMDSMIAALQSAKVINEKLIKWSAENEGLQEFGHVMNNAINMWNELRGSTMGRLNTVAKVSKQAALRGLGDASEIELSQMRIELEMRPSEMLPKVSFMLKALKERASNLEDGLPEEDLEFIHSVILDREDEDIKSHFSEGTSAYNDIQFFRNLVTCLTEIPEDTPASGERIEG